MKLIVIKQSFKDVLLAWSRVWSSYRASPCSDWSKFWQVNSSEKKKTCSSLKSVYRQLKRRVYLNILYPFIAATTWNIWFDGLFIHFWLRKASHTAGLKLDGSDFKSPCRPNFTDLIYRFSGPVSQVRSITYCFAVWFTFLFYFL